MESEIHVVPGDSRRAAVAEAAPANEARLSELFRQLANDSTTLIRQELALARAEMRANAKAIGKNAAMLAVGGSILLTGMLVLTAFLVALIGDTLDNYWLAALIVGGVYALIGTVMLMRGKSNLQREGLTPDRTIATLKEDRRWAQAEIQQVRRDLSA